MRKVSDQWDGGDKSKFRAWAMKAENYLYSGNDQIEIAMKWAAKQMTKIDWEKLENDRIGLC